MIVTTRRRVKIRKTGRDGKRTTNENNTRTKKAFPNPSARAASCCRAGFLILFKVL